MKVGELIALSLEESREYVAQAVAGLKPKELAFRPEPHSNCIAFLMWHVARGEDLWINAILLREKQLYEAGGWYKKFDTSPQDSGFGFDVAKLDAWPVPTLSLLKGYAAAVRQKTLAYLKTLTASELDKPRDFGWRKGTTGSALAHLVAEVAEHSGQIGYLRGIQRGIEPLPPLPPPKQ
jgi:uncharacterized damage-inducible protein DinB